MRPSRSVVTTSIDCGAGAPRSSDSWRSRSAIRACRDSWSLGVIVALSYSVPRNLREQAWQPRDGVGSHLRGPLRVHGVEAEESEVEGEVGHEEGIAGEDEAGGEEEPVGFRVSLEPVEVAELADHLSGGVDDDDLVALVGADPDVVRFVDDEAVGAVDAVRQH